MATCNGCGGRVGRDCFNPQECEWISHQQQQDYQNKAETAHSEVQQLRNEVYELRGIIESLLSELRELKIIGALAEPNLCYKTDKPCDCPGLCRESC